MHKWLTYNDVLEMSQDECKCDHDGLLGVSGPILMKLNWKGSNFKAGSWGKDSAIGTKSKDHYWVFPANEDNRIWETFRVYSSYRKLMLYYPVMEFSLQGAKDKCENCGQGGGVIFFNGSFYYNCYNSRALCMTDPHTMRLLRKELEDDDPASFNNIFSYKGVKFQDVDMAGDEKGLWMVHGSTKANGNMVIRKVNPNNLQVGTPWTTSQKKVEVTNSFMICGVLYATRRVNATHEEIFYAFDTKTDQEHKTPAESSSTAQEYKILMEKPLPTVQSLNYNPNDQKLYMYNDGFLVYYNLIFKRHRASRPGQAVGAEQGQDVNSEEGQGHVIKQAQAGLSKKDHNSPSDQKKNLTSKGNV
ncbi:olfactomedin-like [Elgaria multicarinata webbii]|uniref:olfactomedin-like n=1 Tax=Elgaria multicarinata webbii TaxID=159646 RepID=UPI002FCCDFF9